MFPSINPKQDLTLRNWILVLSHYSDSSRRCTDVVTISKSPLSFVISQPHPLPWIPASVALKEVINWSTDPYFDSIACLIGPAGSSYDLGGVRFSQNNYSWEVDLTDDTEWLMCPPPLNRMRGCNAIWALTFLLSSASWYFSNAVFYGQPEQRGN